MKKSNNPWAIFCWVVVIVMAGFLRFENLDDRPFHFDEATGARITSDRIDPAADYRFNPVHNHGPLLSASAAAICRLNGESSWQKMTKLSLRLVPAIAGTLLVLIPLYWRRRFGDVPMLAAATLLATSPLLVYYSRVFIHEMLLSLCGLAAIVLLVSRPRYGLWKFGLVGVWVGLMFATKETFAISMLAWMGAAVLVSFSRRREIARLNWKRLWLDYRQPLTIGLATTGITAGWFYTDGLTNLKGVWDAIRTFFVYKTGAGHDKPFLYYIDMLVIPTKSAIWWFETPVLILAVIAFAKTYLPGTKPNSSTHIIRFLAYAAVIHVLIYSSIPYKTPWLMCLPWAHVCLLAGLSLGGFSHWRAWMKAVALLCLFGVLFSQTRLARYAAGRFASDTRNPYVYTPTNRDVESVQQWMRELSKELPPGALEPVAVVGTEYWPLPWYLRDFESVGYWVEPDAVVAKCPLVLVMPEHVEEVIDQLEKTHVALPRSLRADVPFMLFLRNDHWQHWIAPESP